MRRLASNFLQMVGPLPSLLKSDAIPIFHGIMGIFYTFLFKFLKDLYL